MPAQSTDPVAEPLVLVVDDFEDARLLYMEFLIDSGFRAEGACDGLDAVEKTRELHPRVVVMDMGMPRLDGWEATRILKNDPTTKGIYIVALTGHAGTNHRNRAEEVGVDAFLMKPCLPADLLKCVRSFLALDVP